LVSVDAAAVYDPGVPCQLYVQSLWRARQAARDEGDRHREQCVKLLMNSLVGKWAAHSRAWTDDARGLPPDAWSSWYVRDAVSGALERWRSVGWHVQRLEVGGQPEDATPALAAWTYSVGRMRLWDWMEEAGREDVVYVDSDSVMCTAEGATRLHRSGEVRPGQLGALRLQGVYKLVRIGGIKDYAADAIRVQAGTPTAGTIERQGVVQWWRNSTVGESVSEGHAPDATARLVTVPVCRPYRHGVVDGSGRVSPLIVRE
jgi:hypothetical protein